MRQMEARIERDLKKSLPSPEIEESAGGVTSEGSCSLMYCALYTAIGLFF